MSALDPGGKPIRRFALSLVLALVLHGVALHSLRFPVSPAGRKAALEVVLSAAQPPSIADLQDLRRGAAITGTVASSLRRAERQPVSAGDEPPPSTPLRESQPAIGAARLLESARRIVREEAKIIERGTVGVNEHPPDTVEGKLAKALRPPSAGEKRLDGGWVKITTAFGTGYCLKAPPDNLREGPSEPISIPMTCP
ncbi:MAG: hypothetical protein PHX38_09955 [Sulfuricella sp.]|nr:hypothetical protein [Sulfuricella sp.]